MARKKSRATKEQKARQPQEGKVAHPSESSKGSKVESTAPVAEAAKEDGVSSGRKKSEISAVTAVAGMLLTLVLGLYMGSLLPGLFMEKEAPLPQDSAQPPKPAFSDNLDPRLRKSIVDLEKRVESEPTSPPNWINLGNAYFDGHMPQKAINAYERALALAPNNPDVLTDLGIMYREIGRYEKAVECFRKAVALDPGHQNALFNAGVVLDRDLKQKAEAAAMWEQLLSLNPQAQAPNGVPVSEMVRELRQQTPGATDKL